MEHIIKIKLTICSKCVKIIINTTIFLMERKIYMKYKNEEAARKVYEEVHKCIQENGGIVKKEQLSKLGIDYRRIIEMVESGELVRIKNGYYTDKLDSFSEEELIAKLFPDARLCMESALYAYGYSGEAIWMETCGG